MAETGKPWWHDPKFVIPSILIPVLAILAPFLFTEKVSSSLSVVIDIVDPRESHPDSNIEIEKIFPVNQQTPTAKHFAHELATSIAEKIESVVQTNPENRQPFEVSVYQEADGSLVIKEVVPHQASIHLTRFPEMNSLMDLLTAEFPNRFVQMTLEETNLFPPQPQNEVATPKPVIEAGVYRVAVTAPGYRDGFRFLELSSEGNLFMADDMGEVTQVTFPLSISLYPRLGESGRLVVAIQPFPPCTTLATHKPFIEGIEDAIQSSLGKEMKKKNFSVFEVGAGMKLGFHPYRIRRMPPPENHKFADFLVKGSCHWGNN